MLPRSLLLLSVCHGVFAWPAIMEPIGAIAHADLLRRDDSGLIGYVAAGTGCKSPFSILPHHLKPPDVSVQTFKAALRLG